MNSGFKYTTNKRMTLWLTAFQMTLEIAFGIYVVQEDF